MKEIPTRCGVWLLAAALVLLAGPGLVDARGFDDSSPELALVTFYSNGIEFQTYVAFSEAVVSVSGGETTFRQLFAGGEYPSITGYDLEGELLADGSYSWELKMTPDAATARELRLAANENGGEAPNAWRPLAGTFTIRDGQFVSPDLVEEVAPVEDRESVSNGNVAPVYADSFGASDRDSEDSDAVGASEDEVQAAAASASATATSPAAAGLQAPDRGALDDSDREAELRGRSLEEQLAPASVPTDASRAPVPYRSIEPGGINGRPTGDEDSATEQER